MSVAILGPTFQDLAANVNRNISSLSLIFVGRAFGYLGGSVIGGVLFDIMNHFLLLGMSMFATTIGLYLVPFCKTAVLLIVMMSIFGVSVGILDTESEAAGLNSIFWGTFAACRGMAIFFATCLQPGTMIVLSNIGSLASSLFLVLFNKSRVCLWIATSVYGASMATTFPSGVSWIEQYTTIHGKAAAFFVVGAALGEMAIPAVIGILQGKYPDLPVVLYTCLGSSVATAVLFPVLYKLATLPISRQHKEHSKSEDQKALLSSSGLNDCEEENEEEDAEKWNEMDFEVIEMNDTVRNSVIETSRYILMEPTADVSNQSHSNALMFESSPVNMGKSPVNHLARNQDKRD
ncbi:sodium-dependent glucose transporter 1 isoform X1 [Tursiops truncatus]|uniref:sodium-dependent glucose transporter 1 isoform X1 n=1 Tax=Tursiops truncatus TaxID=9739 RepID=UPI003CCF7394